MKKLLKFLLNPWLCIFLYFAALLFATGLFLVKHVIVSILKQEVGVNVKVNKNKQGLEKMYLSNNAYSSIGYSMDTNDAEKRMTTAGIICILPNGNILHVIMTGENVNGRMKKTEETINFITNYQDEIFNDIARTIVEAGQKLPFVEPEKEKPLQGENDAPVKKKV